MRLELDLEKQLKIWNVMPKNVHLRKDKKLSGFLAMHLKIEKLVIRNIKWENTLLAELYSFCISNLKQRSIDQVLEL